MKRYLITTADERSWKLDRPVLFLGEWCRLYGRRQLWRSLDAEVAEPFGLGTDQKARDLDRVQRLSTQLLRELTDALNAFHGTRHDLRYWQILLGHWVQRFAAVMFNRYFTLEQALQKYEVSGTAVLDLARPSLATADSYSFIWACNADEWNHVLYSRILEYWSYPSVEHVRGHTATAAVTTSVQVGSMPLAMRIKRSALDLGNALLSGLGREHDAFIINSYLPKKAELKLQVHLRQWPQFWQSPRPQAVTADAARRRGLVLDSAGHDGFEKFLRQQLPDVIPTCYLEGYPALVEQAGSLSWPKKPKFIFTSNNFDTDEVFKAWTATRVQQGTIYFTGQHGNNYGTLLGSEHWPELVTCDNFFTWGWDNGSSKNIPAFMFKSVGRPLQGGAPDGDLLLIELCVPHRVTARDNYSEFHSYQEEQFQFVTSLPAHVQQQLTVRLHADHRRLTWSEEQRWQERCPHIRLEPGMASIRDLMARSRLVVHSYDSTGILETLAADIPTVSFWHGGLDHLLPSARPYYELLRNAGIAADTPAQAARLIASHWDNIAAWWRSEVVQDARRTFCSHYARTERHPILRMKRLLLEATRIRRASDLGEKNKVSVCDP